MSEAEIAQAALPGLVTIQAQDADGKTIQSGSGFVLNRAGLIVTNYHVIGGADAATVTLDSGETYPAEGVTFADKGKDLAILRVRAPKLHPLALGDSDQLTLGGKTLAIGSPLGLDKTVTNGIVSQVRQQDGVKVIQHTAAISPGSSGGPLLDGEARVIGVNTFYLAKGQSLYFAMPANYLAPHKEALQVTARLADLRKKDEEAAKRELMDSLAKSLTMFHHPDGWFDLLLPKSYATNATNEVSEDSIRTVGVVAQAPDAERDGNRGWLSDGVRVKMRVAPRGKVWSDDFRSAWPTRQAAALIGGYDKHFIGSNEPVQLAGMAGRSMFVRGTSPDISETEASYLHVLESPSCVTSVEITAPAAQSDKLRILNELVIRSFQTHCP
jgi:hypothetical protein